MPRRRVGIFHNERTRSPHWSLNSCFRIFHSVWVHWGSFCSCMKLGAKRAELVQLMQKFLARTHVEIFHNERTRSTPLDPKVTFWCISNYLGAFGTVLLPYETRRKIGRTSAKVRDTKSRRNFSQRTHPIHPIGP